MWFCLFCLAILLGIAFFQSIHGLFSGLIFCVIAVISTGLAFALYEYVAYEFLVEWKPDLALPIALAACFGVPLVVGRAAMDALVRRSGLLPAMADRVGGFVFGMITALLCVGVAAIAIQMLPFGGSFMTFARFDRPKDDQDAENNARTYLDSASRMRAGEDNSVWLSPDGFAAGFATMLSDGLFSGQRSFREDHPDLLVEAGWQQAADLGVRHVAAPGQLMVGPVQVVPSVRTKVGGTRGSPDVQYELEEPQPGRAFWMLNLRPPPEAAQSGMHYFTLPQIRLVGKDRGGQPAQFIPCAVRDAADATKHVSKQRQGNNTFDQAFTLWQPGDAGDIEVVFDVPDGFEPSFVAYKSGARASVSPPSQGGAQPPGRSSVPAGTTPGTRGSGEPRGASSRSERGPSGSPPTGAPPSSTSPPSTPPPSASPPATPASGTPAPGTSAPPPPGSGTPAQGTPGSGTPPPPGSASGRPPSSGGRVTGARARAAESFFGDQLPVTLAGYERSGAGEVEVRGQVLHEGALYAFLARQNEGGGQSAIARFYVPEGKRLLQLSVEHLRAGSTLGQALNFATQTIRNYIVTDDTGQRYEMAGRYAIAEVDGDDVLEIQYYPEQIGSVGRGIRDFDRVKERHLGQPDARYVFLFLVDEGRQAVEFSTGPRGRIDLTPYNLRAE